MLIFCKTKKGRVIVPLSRVYDIRALETSVIINYDCGDLVWLDGDKYEKKIESVFIEFADEDEVDKVIRQFYKACRDNANSFYFG